MPGHENWPYPELSQKLFDYSMSRHYFGTNCPISGFEIPSCTLGACCVMTGCESAQSADGVYCNVKQLACDDTRWVRR